MDSLAAWLHLLTMDSVVQSWIVAKSAKECEGLLPVHTQSTLRGMARGLAHMHSGLLAKIADFGCSKHLRTPPPGPGSANGLWPTVSLADVTCTWPYRDPEITLLLPCFPTDGWSFGVIARELVTGRSLYQLTVGTDSSCMCGPITNAVWPDVQSAPFYKQPSPNFKPDDWKARRFGKVDEISSNFVHSILQADPAKRPTVVAMGGARGASEPVRLQ